MTEYQGQLWEEEIGSYLDDMNNTISSGLNGSQTSLTEIQMESLAVLSIVNQGPAQLFVVSGIIGLLASICIIVTITLTRKLHTKNYALVVCLALSDSLMACTLISIGIRRMWAFCQSTPMVVSRFQCLLEDAPRAFATACINGFFFTSALDRLLAVAKPHWYRSEYPNWLFGLMVSFSFVRATVEIGVLFFGIDATEMISVCSYNMAADLDVQASSMIRTKILYVAICVVFFATMVITFYRLKRMKRQSNKNAQSNRNQMQTKVLWTLAAMLICYFVSIISTNLLFMFIAQSPAAVQVKYGAFCFTFQEACALCNFLILVVQNDDFRKGFLGLLQRVFCSNKFIKILPIGLSTCFVKVDAAGSADDSSRVSISKGGTRKISQVKILKY